MNIAVRYYTRSGNTKKIATAIADAVQTVAAEVSEPLTEPVDILFLGSSVYGGDADAAVKVFLKNNAEKIGILVNFSTAAIVKSTYKQISKLAEKYGIPLAGKEFHCRGSFSVLHKNRPNDEDLKNAAEFAKQIANR